MTRRLNLIQENSKENNLNRRLLLIAAGIYFLWWFAVEAILPGSFNPLMSRLFVVLVIFSIYLASFFSSWVYQNLRILFVSSAWLITVHYYYLFFGNSGDVNWIVGSYVTIMAINLCLLSGRALLSYSIFVVVLSMVLVILIPSLRSSVFLPGLITILIQANLGLHSRLSIIKNLVESNERFQLLLNSVFEGVLVHQNGAIVNASDALLKMLGYSKEEIIGKDPLDLLHPSVREIGAAKLKIADVAPYETKALTKNKQVIDIEIRAKDFTYNKSPARLVAILDISDRKRAEKERIKSLTLAENMRVRDEFMSIASHELKTPLTALSLQMQLIEKDFDKDSVGLIHRQIQRLTDLVETMLDVSRISVGVFHLDSQQVDLAAIVKNAVKSKANSTIEVSVPEHLFISGDSHRLAQLVDNLITNAIKYGGGKPIEVRLQQENMQAILTIKDHGMGIAPEFLPQIFGRFERGVSARNITGFGVGLYISKKIVDAHRGDINVNSEVGLGSTFRVQLPLKQMDVS
jgi:PAS domain S-box-containing protein